jgi:hypothetical protein
MRPFSCSTLGLARGLEHKHYTRLEKLARDKHSSLFGLFVGDKDRIFEIKFKLGLPVKIRKT